MSQMDDIEKAMQNNPEFKEAVEREGQALQATLKTQDAMPDDQTTDNSNNSNSSSNTNADPELGRSINSDVGNMDGRQIPDSGNNAAPTQMDSIEAANPEIPDSLKAEVASQMDRLEAAGVEKANNAELSSPSQTPTVEKDEPSMER